LEQTLAVTLCRLLPAASLLLGACGAPVLYVSRLEAPPALPAPAITPIPLNVALAVPQAVDAAAPESMVTALGITQFTRHEFGAAGAGVLREALRLSFESVVEAWPDAREPPAGSALLFVPGVPAVNAHIHEHDVVVGLRQRVTYPFELRGPGGAVLAHWSVEGAIARGMYADWFIAQDALDTAMLRNAAATLMASLYRPPLADVLAQRLGASPAAPAAAGAAPPAPTRLGMLRLDAGFAHDEALEARITQCVTGMPAPVPLVRAGVLRDAVFPWLEPGVAPLEADALAVTLARPRLQVRLADMGIRRLLLFTVTEARRATQDDVLCGSGAGAGACIGYYEHRFGYAVSASMWDVATARPFGSTENLVTRKLGVVGVLLPIPFISSDEPTACEALRAFVQAGWAAP
jgi:hypothetical protein